ncbi:hypothetical protein [Neptuniibacter sp.]|uniref:hypothetical protein n=1 Tax=Neptuniibacter sp. TaxID=1962643 RepID=UPI003B5C4D51
MPPKSALKKSPPFYWDDNWHPYLVFSIDYLDEYKYPYFSVSGFIYGTRFAVIISPLKQYSFKLDAPFFIRRIDDVTFEVSTILEHKNMVDYKVLAFVRPRDALLRRSRNKKLEKMNRIKEEPRAGSGDSLSSEKAIIARKATSTFPKISHGVCHSCGHPIIHFSTDKKPPIKMDHLKMPWSKHRCWEDRKHPEANSWGKAFLQHVTQEREGVLLIVIKCEEGVEYRLRCTQPDMRLNKKLPLCMKKESSKQLTLSAITTHEGKKLHQHFWQCEILP